MNKKILLTFSIILIIICTTITGSLAFEEPVDLSLEEAIRIANQELGEEYYYTPAKVKINETYATMELNWTIWNERQYLVYGGPDTIPVSQQDFRGGHYRYLGYTINGDLFPDPDFPADHPS